MINFRRLKQEFSPGILKEGKAIFENGQVLCAKILKLTGSSVRLGFQVAGNFDNSYTCELEIDRKESELIDSDCDCSYSFDCQHIVALLFFLEQNLDQLIVSFSNESKLEAIAEEDKEEIQLTIEKAHKKEKARKGIERRKELLEEYCNASDILGRSPFFTSDEAIKEERAELIVILQPQVNGGESLLQELRLALRLPTRSKALNVHNIKEFFNGVRYHEAVYLGNRRHYFGLRSFDNTSSQILKMLMDFGRFKEGGEDREENDKAYNVVLLDREGLGTILSFAYSLVQGPRPALGPQEGEQELSCLPCFYFGGIEEPLRFSSFEAAVRFEIERMDMPAPKLFLQPTICLAEHQGKQTIVKLEEVILYECAQPGLLHKNVYSRFQKRIKRKHLRHLPLIAQMTIPEPLFGTFIENALPELSRYADVANKLNIEDIVTLPYVQEVEAVCDLTYVNNELEATLHFIYNNKKIPAVHNQLTHEEIEHFVTDAGILARNLTQEQKIINDLFLDFQYNKKEGSFIAKTEKKIVEFMTDVILQNLERVQFHCPDTLLEKFIYDQTTFEIHLSESKFLACYQLDLIVHGDLEGFTTELLWDCLASKRNYIELGHRKKRKRGQKGGGLSQILVLDLQRLAPVVQLFDELGIQQLDNHREDRPLWSLVSITEESFKELPIQFSMTKGLKRIQQQMLGNEPMEDAPVPKAIQGTLREYQKEGVNWLSRLRGMCLNGILADDMGLGKTLQSITAITQFLEEHPNVQSVVVCPTSLIYNWKEELHKFNPTLRVLVVDGTPTQRKKLIVGADQNDVLITSYSLMQKDIESYEKINFGYAILDEAQHIKNRTTLNAKSVKRVQALHKLILTGTPIENSLDELWSLFDFLMPGLLSTYDRFVDKFVRAPLNGQGNLDPLRKKVSPFILRRMKEDVVKDLPPISNIVYHTTLSDVQKELYRAYATSAREELSKLVEKEGFDKVQIQVLATLTRLKQICCHPAIFAKETAEPGDSAKYDLLLELLQSLMESGQKTVIFSQYTRMLKIMRDDFEKKGIRFSYLDGSSKNRMSIVKEFNETPDIPIFLVSLKAGGTGLNLTGASAVIHFDLWWNPAVEEQATARAHRIGQKADKVQAFKLVTKGTIEEKILEVQERKRGLVKSVIADVDDALSKLTWSEVWELLQC